MDSLSKSIFYLQQYLRDENIEEGELYEVLNILAHNKTKNAKRN